MSPGGGGGWVPAAADPVSRPEHVIDASMTPTSDRRLRGAVVMVIVGVLSTWNGPTRKVDPFLRRVVVARGGVHSDGRAYASRR
jgi:hypothetical protein